VSNVTLVIIAVVVAVVIVVAALVAFFVSRRRRTQQERQERARAAYGPEYERTVQERGSEREAEKELRERRERLEDKVRPLSEESRKRYDERWQGVERTFVDDPWASLEEADRVVADILAERNFPTDSRQEASRGVGVMHPQVIEDFREAQRVHRDATASEGEADLEEMRRAIQMYRSVYERLTGG
jgi:polyhydroxyalkanoate synthesis regulator phasin